MDRVATFRIPMRLPFRRVTERAGVLVHGPGGWGEFSPFPDYGSDVTPRWWAAAREAATDGFPPAVRDRVAVNAVVPAVDPETAHRIAGTSGCATVKVKVAEPGQDLDDDRARVAAVRDALGTSGHIRVDANGAWDVDEATRAIEALARYDLEFVEQPVATLDEMAALRSRVDVPLAADESVRTADDPLRIAGLEAADILVLKVQPLGGVHRCLEVADAAGLPVVVSSAVETSVGLAAGLALAASLPELPYACGLGTAALLEGDVVTDPLAPVDGWLSLRRPEPDDDLLDRWRAPDEDALLDRLAAAGALEARATSSSDVRGLLGRREGRAR